MGCASMWRAWRAARQAQRASELWVQHDRVDCGGSPVRVFAVIAVQFTQLPVRFEAAQKGTDSRQVHARLWVWCGQPLRCQALAAFVGDDQHTFDGANGHAVDDSVHLMHQASREVAKLVCRIHMRSLSAEWQWALEDNTFESVRCAHPRPGSSHRSEGLRGGIPSERRRSCHQPVPVRTESLSQRRVKVSGKTQRRKRTNSYMGQARLKFALTKWGGFECQRNAHPSACPGGAACSPDCPPPARAGRWHE